MRRTLVLLVIAACGKDDGAKPATGAAAAQPDPSAPSAPAKKGVSGNIMLSGALTGTFEAKEPDNLHDCGWVRDLKTGGIDVTLFDGPDTVIALQAIYSKDRTTVTISSLKLPRGKWEQAGGGVVMTGTGNTGGNDPTTVTAQIDSVMTVDGKTLKAKGTLVARCN
jgi:hypothetical protein